MKRSLKTYHRECNSALLTQFLKIKVNPHCQAPGSSKCQFSQKEGMDVYITNYFHKQFCKGSILDWTKLARNTRRQNNKNETHQRQNQ